MAVKLLRNNDEKIEDTQKYILLIFFILIQFGSLSCTFRSENNTFKLIADEFIDESFSGQPAFATTCGVHDFDDQLDDISAAALENQIKQLENSLQQLALIDTTKLTLKNQADYILLNNYIQNRLIDLKDVKIWQKNPVIFTETLGNSLYWLLHYKSTDWNTRLQNILKRLYQIPRFIEQLKEYVVAATPCHIDVAIEQTQGLIDFIRNDITESFQHTPSLEDTLRKVSRDAIRALDAYQRYLKYDLMLHASQHFRLGEPIFHKKLQLSTGSQITSEAILKLANEALQDVQMEMISTAREVQIRYFPKIQYVKNNNHFNKKLIRDALKVAMRQTLSKEELLPFLENQFRDATRFVELRELAELKLNVPVKFEFMPLFLQGYFSASCFFPGIRLDPQMPAGDFTFFFYTGYPRWNWIQNQNYYKIHNSDMLRVFVLSHLMPGTHFQYNYSEKNTSRVRRLLGDPMLIGGWQIYSPYIMRKAGYTGYEPRFILMQLKYTLNCILDAILDIKIHTTEFSELQAKALLREQGFMNDPEIKFHWRKICLKPTYHAIKFMGYMKLIQLQTDYREKMGNLYNQKKFIENILKSGFVPIQFIRKSLFK